MEKNTSLLLNEDGITGANDNAGAETTGGRLEKKELQLDR